jgi:hypothetical protein
MIIPYITASPNSPSHQRRFQGTSEEYKNDFRLLREIHPKCYYRILLQTLRQHPQGLSQRDNDALYPLKLYHLVRANISTKGNIQP